MIKHTVAIAGLTALIFNAGCDSSGSNNDGTPAADPRDELVGIWRPVSDPETDGIDHFLIVDEEFYFTHPGCRFGEFAYPQLKLGPIDNDFSFELEMPGGDVHYYNFEIVEGDILASLSVYDEKGLLKIVGSTEYREKLTSAPGSCSLENVEVELMNLKLPPVIVGEPINIEFDYRYRISEAADATLHAKVELENEGTAAYEEQYVIEENPAIDGNIVTGFAEITVEGNNVAETDVVTVCFGAVYDRTFSRYFCESVRQD